MEKLRNTYTLGAFMVLLTALGACNNDPKTFVPNRSDTFINNNRMDYRQASALLQADYLFVLDYSASMDTVRDSLIESMTDFTEMLKEEEIDFRLGFVDGNIQSTNPKPREAVNNNFMNSEFITANMSSKLTRLVAEELDWVGTALQPNVQVPLETADRLLSRRGSSFLRQGSQLVYVFISDDNDKSDTYINSKRTESYFIERLRSHRSNNDHISARAIVAGDLDSACAPGTFQGYGEKIANVAKAIDSVNSEALCINDNFSATLEGLARDVTRPTRRFALRAPPVVSSIRVRENDSLVPASGNWSYVASSNEIVFKSGKEPLPEAKLNISYEVFFGLTAKPNISSVEVEVDGRLIQQSNSNGWSYVEADNRIRFNGNSLPSGANVIIRYNTLSN